MVDDVQAELGSRAGNTAFMLALFYKYKSTAYAIVLAGQAQSNVAWYLTTTSSVTPCVSVTTRILAKCQRIYGTCLCIQIMSLRCPYQASDSSDGPVAEP